MLGSQVNLQGLTLPAVAGDTSTYRLPAIAAADDVRVYAGPCSIQGTVFAGDVFTRSADLVLRPVPSSRQTGLRRTQTQGERALGLPGLDNGLMAIPASIAHHALPGLVTGCARALTGAGRNNGA